MARPIDDLIQSSVPAEVQERARKKASIILSEMDVLSKIRKLRNITQKQLSEEMSVNQGNVSQTEKRAGKITLETLQRYVDAMGGSLEIRAVFPDEEIHLGLDISESSITSPPHG